VGVARMSVGMEGGCVIWRGVEGCLSGRGRWVSHVGVSILKFFKNKNSKFTKITLYVTCLIGGYERGVRRCVSGAARWVCLVGVSIF